MNDPRQCSHTEMEYTGDSYRSPGVKWTHWDCKQCNSIVWLDQQCKVMRILPMEKSAAAIEGANLPGQRQQV